MQPPLKRLRLATADLDSLVDVGWPVGSSLSRIAIRQSRDGGTERSTASSGARSNRLRGVWRRQVPLRVPYLRQIGWCHAATKASECQVSVTERSACKPGTAEEPCSPREPAVGGTDTVRRIHSVERVLCSQTLNTPDRPAAGAHAHSGSSGGKGEGHAPAADDFRIRCSQTYGRARLELEFETAGTPGQAGRSQPTAGHAGQPEKLQGGPAQRRGAAPRQSLTPELVIDDHPTGHSAEGSAPGPASRRLFSIFRPASERKVLHIIRHGESEYNAATNAGKDFKDPQIFNPRLTEKGKRQATQLSKVLEKLGKLDGALWVSSPLTRAIETLLISCPKAPLARGCALGQLQIAIRSELSEHLVTTGDIGLPVTCLRQRYPLLQDALAHLPERWWYAPDSNDSLARQFGKTEPKQTLKERVGEFRRWVEMQQEQVIVAYGHSSMIRELSGGRRLKNCELLTLRI